MTLAPELFTKLDPPTIWVTLDQAVTTEHETRGLTVRIKPRGCPSISATVPVSIYSPEGSCFSAVAHCLDRLASLQRQVNREVLASALRDAVVTWVDPF